MKKTRFATFWHGTALSPYEVACLSSFARHGEELAVYSYGEVGNLPAGVALLDARAILPPDSMQLFKVRGVSSTSHFTDYFRFVMFTKTDQVWVDTDIVLLKPFGLDASGNFMGKESPTSVCTAVLHLDPSDRRLRTMIDRVESLSSRSLVWGDTGPRLLTSVYGVADGLPQRDCYPVHFDDFWKVFLPQYRDECERLCADATTLHLWNNLVVDLGLFKKIGPPTGSFLHGVFQRHGCDVLFDESYPESVMKRMVHNAVVKVGRDAGVKSALALLLPCFRSSLQRRWPALAR